MRPNSVQKIEHKQPIAVNLEVIKSLIENWSNHETKTERTFHRFVELLESFHIIYIDKTNSHSRWNSEYMSIINSIKNDNIKKYFIELLSPKNLKFFPIQINSVDDLYISLADSTPDKVGIHIEKKRISELLLYDIESFNSYEFDANNILFRLPKLVEIKPSYKFSDLRLFCPYLRNAETIEFCDLYLFSNKNFNGEKEFIFRLLNIPVNLKQIIFHCNPNPFNLIQKKFEKELKSLLNGRCSYSFTLYNKSGNHDRFILIDNNKYSIRFSTSFNNLRLDNDVLCAKSSFIIEFSTGRKYYYNKTL